mgnify:CR=1 FL=1
MIVANTDMSLRHSGACFGYRIIRVRYQSIRGRSFLIFTDIGVMQLVERGEPDLDAPITDYLPGTPARSSTFGRWRSGEVHGIRCARSCDRDIRTTISVEIGNGEAVHRSFVVPELHRREVSA